MTLNAQLNETPSGAAFYKIEFPATEEGGKTYSCKLSKPSLAVMKHAFTMITPSEGQKPDIIGAGEKIIASCWIEGDAEIKSDPELYIAACIQAVGLVKVREATLAKI